ncbi:MAG: hypothetical protein WD231_00400 [Candidatus Woykebacteria bacterium]
MKLKHLWLILAAYGVWFAILSGLVEASNGKYWKLVLSLVLGLLTYWVIEKKMGK